VKEKNIHKVLFSMNIHQVATPEMMLEDARSYVLFFRENRGRLSAYIALHLMLTNRSLYYSYSGNPFLDKKMGTVEEEAVAFVESLGAMLDEIYFSKITDSEKELWINKQEIFSQKQSPETGSAPKPVAQTKLAVPVSQPVPQALPAQPASHVKQEAPAPQSAAQAQATAPIPQQVSTPAQPVPQALPAQPASHVKQEAPAPQSAAQAQATAPIPQQVSTPAQPVPQAPLAQPRQNLMHELRAAIPQQQPVQPLTTPGMVSPLPLTSKVQNLQRLIRHNLHNQLKMLRMRGMNRFISNKTAPSVQQLKVQEQQSTLMRQQDIMQEAIKAHIAKPPKQSQSTESQKVTDVVKRDREALARLMSSF